MKKSLAIGITLLAVLAFSCGGGKYGDVKKLMNEMIGVMDSYSTSIAAAQNADDVVKAMEAFGGAMIKMQPEMEKLNAKYPEMKDKKDEVPEELKETFKKLEASTQKMVEASGPVMVKYMQDPKVMEAAKKMSEAFSK